MDFTIADNLVALRRAHGYSQETLADRLGLSRQAVSRWERGESLPDTENLIALADLYGVTLDDLVRPQAAADPTADAEEASPEGAVEEAASEVGATDSDEKREANANDVDASGDVRVEPDSGPVTTGDASEADEAAPVGDVEPPAADEVVVPTDDTPACTVPDTSATDAHDPGVPSFGAEEQGPSDGGGVETIAYGASHTGGSRESTGAAQAASSATAQGFSLPVPYSALVAVAYVFMGLSLGLWHPGWLIFLTIPLYENWQKGTGDDRSRANSLVAIALALLLASVVMGALMSMFSFVHTSRVETSSEHVVVGDRDESTSSFTINGKEVSNIDLSWAAGDVALQVVPDRQTDGSVVVTEEYLDRKGNQTPMQVKLSHGTLKIDYGTSKGFGLVSCSANLHGKNLTVLVPKSLAAKLGSVQVELLSGGFTSDGLTCDTMKLDVASGNAIANGIVAKTLDVDVASGEVSVVGEASDKIDVEVSSGSAEVSTTVTPRKADIDVSSGSAILRLPADAGFAAKVEVSSGDFSTSFKAIKEGDTYYVGDRGAHIDVDVSSGEASIERLK